MTSLVRSKRAQAPQREIGALEIRTLLSGEYDSVGCAGQHRSGAGESMPQTGRDADAHVHATANAKAGRWRSSTPLTREDNGIKSATFQVSAPYAYPSASSREHPRSRISPFDNQGRRQTSPRSPGGDPVMDGRPRDGHP